MGLYREYEGEIYLNGRDLKSYSLTEIRRIFSIVSQDFARYHVSLRDNIAFDDQQGDISVVLDQLELKGLLDKLPMKEHSQLGIIHEKGVDISGGEWQRIAIARALYQNTPFIIMDEPTSSLSPVAESRIYQQLLNIANQKSLLMISHRLGSTKISDEIIVLDKGKIIEQGSHDFLMDNNHIYAQLFRKQSDMYA